MTNSIEKFQKQLSDIQSLLNFPVMLRKFWSGSEVQDWLNSTLIERIKQFIEFYQKELAHNELLSEAANEAIQYSLDLSLLSSDDAMSFLQAWNEGDWTYIVDSFPNFNINSEAQQVLIKESGGMPT